MKKLVKYLVLAIIVPFSFAQELKISTGNAGNEYVVSNSPVLVLPNTITSSELLVLTSVNNKIFQELITDSYIKNTATNTFSLTIKEENLKSVNQLLSSPITDIKLLDYLYFTNRKGEVIDIKTVDDYTLFIEVDSQIKTEDFTFSKDSVVNITIK